MIRPGLHCDSLSLMLCSVCHCRSVALPHSLLSYPQLVVDDSDNESLSDM